MGGSSTRNVSVLDGRPRTFRIQPVCNTGRSEDCHRHSANGRIRRIGIASVLAPLLALAFTSFAFQRRARADDAWINLGVSEIVVIPDPQHYAIYGYVAITLPVALEWQQLYLIPGLGFEYAPEVERGGLVGYLTLERSLSEKVAGDFVVTLAHDQPGLSLDEAVYSLGVGLGVSITLGSVVLSPSLSVYRVVDAPSWSLAPTLNLSRAL